MRSLPAIRLGAARRVGAALLAALALWLGWRGYRLAAGDPRAALADASWIEGTRVLARDGRLLGERPSAAGLRGRRTSLEDAGERLVAATRISEDRDFFRHDGIDRAALARALWSNARRGRLVSGGSTITAQLVKRLDHQGRPRPRTVGAKLREMARAQNLEAAVDKRTILEAYLNHLDYGRGLAGPEAAAQGYFGVHARDLSWAQAALLAVLPRAPSALDPYRHLERAVLRQRALLVAMRDRGVLAPEDLERALAEPIVLRPEGEGRPFVAPHLVLAAARGASGDVETTIDLDLQRQVEGLVRAHAARLAERGASNAAVVVVDNASGEVLAEVGSRDWGDARIQGAVDLVRARRQPGSTLKPFVYGRAFERGLSPMEMLADVPTDFGAAGASYAPDNFDGTFAGPVSAREALAGSLNVPAVDVARRLGAPDVVEVLRASGLSLPEGARRYGLSIALGSGEVTPLELAEAYATLARGGEHVPLRHRADEPGAAPARVMAPEAAALVADALSDPLARVRGLRTRGPFELPYPVAIKTGTSTAFRDAWTCGFTRERTVVVWAGNADGAPTRRLTGASGAGPLFTDVMRAAMAALPSRAPLVEPALVEEVEVCPLSGHRPGHACPERVTRRFAKGRAPDQACAAHQHAAPRPAPPGEPAWRCAADGDAAIVVLPDAYARWLADRPLGAPGADARGLPWFAASRVPGCAARDGQPPRIVVRAPRDGAVLLADRASRDVDAVDVEVETRGLAPRERLEVLVDGRVALALDAPYRARVPVARGDHVLEIRPADGRVAALLGRARVSVR